MVSQVRNGGVRRYQNADGTYTEAGLNRRRLNKEGGIYLKKGSKIQRVSSTDEFNTKRKDKSDHTYASFDQFDNFKYKKCVRGLGGSNFTYDAPNGYQIDFVLKDDLIAPTLEKSINTAIDTLKDKSMKEVNKALIDKKGYMKSNLYDDPKDFIEDLTKSDKNGKISDLQKRAYLHYSRNLMQNKQLRDEFFNRLKKEGYNAVVDYNDVASTTHDSEGKVKMTKGFSSKPVIIFESSKTLERTGSHKITNQELANDAKKLANRNDRKATVGAILGAVATAGAAFPLGVTVHPGLAVAVAVELMPMNMVLGGTIASGSNSDAAFLRTYQKQYEKLAKMEKNDPVAYKKYVKELVDNVNASNSFGKDLNKSKKSTKTNKK